MRARDLFSTALRGVSANVSRSLLTMLGIIIGVGSVVLMSSVGASMQGVILGQISSLGASSMVIFPGQQEGGPQSVTAGFDSLTHEDVLQLKKLTTIRSVAPIIFIPGTSTYENQTATPRVMGVTEEFFANQNIFIERGRLIDASDVEGAKSVAVLAPDAQERLFGQKDPIGKRVKVGDNHFTIVGITKPLGSQFFQNADERIYVPFSKAKQITGQPYVNYITMLSTSNFDVAFDDVKFLLRQRHNIKNPSDDPKKDDFVVRSSAQANQILGAVSLGLTLFITTIAAISLIVGGIGIMNIMLVSVTERTREIGLRKAIGARPRDILFQFLSESALLTSIGGVIGIIGGIALAFVVALIVRRFLDTYQFALSYASILAAFAMAAATGIAFGISPARRAASLPPMEALRYE